MHSKKSRNGRRYSAACEYLSPAYRRDFGARSAVGYFKRYARRLQRRTGPAAIRESLDS